MTRLALLTLLLAGCGGSTTTDRPDPSCTPGSIDVIIYLASPEVEFPGCVEMPASHAYGNTTSRQWCCWKGEVQR